MLLGGQSASAQHPYACQVWLSAKPHAPLTGSQAPGVVLQKCVIGQPASEVQPRGAHVPNVNLVLPEL
jgi:hypothetical protein